MKWNSEMCSLNLVNIAKYLYIIRTLDLKLK